MQIDASATCKYLKHRDKSKADLRTSCLSLKLVATRPDDVKVLTALYQAYTFGGTIDVSAPEYETKMHAELYGMGE